MCDCRSCHETRTHETAAKTTPRLYAVCDFCDARAVVRWDTETDQQYACQEHRGLKPEEQHTETDLRPGSCEFCPADGGGCPVCN